MAQTQSFKPVGQSHLLSVTNVNTGPETVSAFYDGDPVIFLAIVNMSANAIGVVMGPVGKTPAAVFPAAGTPANTFVVPPNTAGQPVIVECPRGPFDVNMIASVAGPSSVAFFPIGPQ
jgi:hypothetical protein